MEVDMAAKKEFIFEPYKVTEVRCIGSEQPRPRSGHSIVCDDVNVYCFGGYNPSLPVSSIQRENPTWRPERPLFRELWSFNLSTRKWKQHRVVENMPDELASNAMFMYGRHLMIFGGTGAPFGNKCSNDVITWRTGPGDARLQLLQTSGVRPPGLYGQAILCHDRHFYAVGGTDGYAYNCDIFRLNLLTLEWEPLFIGQGQHNEPQGRYRHELARVGNKLFIIGGGTGEWSFELMEIPMFDIETRTWSLLVPNTESVAGIQNLAPLARKCHSAVQVNTPFGPQVFVAGGMDRQAVFDDIWRLDLTSMQWTLMKNSRLPHPLYFHSGAVTSYGCMYLFGGIQPRESVATRNNKLYKVWLCIPKLSEICWEAMLHYQPNLEQKDRETLLNTGVPKHFVDRIHPQYD